MWSYRPSIVKNRQPRWAGAVDVARRAESSEATDDRRAVADRQARRAELQEQVIRIATEAGEQTMRD